MSIMTTQYIPSTNDEFVVINLPDTSINSKIIYQGYFSVFIRFFVKMSRFAPRDKTLEQHEILKLQEYEFVHYLPRISLKSPTTRGTSGVRRC